MNIFLSAANDWNVIDICNKFLFVKLEFIAFISLLQNNRAGIPLNLLIKNKKKKKERRKKHSHKFFFNHASRNETNRKEQKLFTIPPPTVLILLPIISIHPSSRFPWEPWNTCLTSGQIYGSSYISSSNSAYNVFNFPIRLPQYRLASSSLLPFTIFLSPGEPTSSWLAAAHFYLH